MKANAKKETIYANIIMLAVFFFAFLGTEYLFDNCMMYVTDASGVVRAQNQMLGVSAIGFLLYNWISGFQQWDNKKHLHEQTLFKLFFIISFRGSFCADGLPAHTEQRYPPRPDRLNPASAFLQHTADSPSIP